MAVPLKQPDNEPPVNRNRSAHAAPEPTPVTAACLSGTRRALFDSHVHLDAPEFDPDRAQVLTAARAAGVRELLVPAVRAATWAGLGAICAADPDLHAAYGLHPCALAQHADTDLDLLAAWLESQPAVAIGECGLDYADPALDRGRQLRLLEGHFVIARRFDLPLVLHARRAFEAVILALRAFGKPLRGVVHSFSGSIEQARALCGLGFLVGIGGPVTYARARRLQRTVAALPLDSVLLETDAPDQPDAAHRGERNEPARLVNVLECVAHLRGMDPDDVAAATTANARRLFLGTG